MSENITNETTTVTSVTNNKSQSFTSMLEDNAGGTSSMRVLMLVWGVGVFIIWGFATVIAALHGVYVAPSIPESVVAILLGVTGGKIVQRYGEK